MAFPIGQKIGTATASREPGRPTLFGKAETARAHHIVALGGGTGLPAVLEGLAELAFEKGETDPHGVTGIVTVTDDGGSLGRLRQQFWGVAARRCAQLSSRPDRSRFPVQRTAAASARRGAGSRRASHWKSAAGCADAGHRRLRGCRARARASHGSARSGASGNGARRAVAGRIPRRRIHRRGNVHRFSPRPGFSAGLPCHRVLLGPATLVADFVRQRPLLGGRRDESMRRQK
jgi:hypothetical protein